MVRTSLILAGLLALAGCAANGPPLLAFQAGGPALVSGHTPADAATGGQNSEPQPVNSLPPGAAGMGTGPNAVQPSYGAVTVHSPLL